MEVAFKISQQHTLFLEKTTTQLKTGKVKEKNKYSLDFLQT